jgi:exodeoxyribonuclease-3
MKIVSWNINSVRIRIPLIEKLVKDENPDIICLQETKTQDEFFPIDEFKRLGFDHVAFDGEKSYNGVAIISKVPLEDVSKIDILDYGHKRHISSKFLDDITLHNFYIPAGGDEADPKINPKFDHKLKFLDWMASFFKKDYDKDSKVIILGDMNIAPLEHDVWSHKQLLKVVSHTPIEVEKMDKIQKSLNFIDSHRMFVADEEKLYSWWSYRGKEPFKSNRGRRLDHIWVSPALKDRVKSAYILKDFRICERPSDHVPIILELK